MPKTFQPASLTFRTMILAAGICLAGLVAGGSSGCSGSKDRVVLYCAQDREFAESCLDSFTGKHGVKVDTKYDTEAAKSVSLFTELVADRNRPRCDVFWNNEILNTIQLQEEGMLEPYDSPAAQPYPDTCQPSDHTWHAFAARARVLLINRDLVKDSGQVRGIFDLTDKRWQGKIGISSPLHGTSATQAACLFEVLGEEGAEKFYLDLKENKVQILPGNKDVAVAVSAGKLAIAITDTDDALAEIHEGKNVAMIFPDRDGHKDWLRLGTLFIPNTVCIIRGAPNLAGAKLLVDYLLSPEVETSLAESDSHQIPLNPALKPKLPAQLETPATVKKSMKVDFAKAAKLWARAGNEDQRSPQRFLTKLFAQ